MLALTPGVSVYLALGATDMRKSFAGLAGAVEAHLKRDPLSGHLFAFCNRRRNMIKVLAWDGSGLCLYAKKLERGTFPWPREEADAQATTLSADDQALILAGVDPVTAPRQRGWWRCAPTRVAS